MPPVFHFGEGAITSSFKASNEPRRVALLGGIVSPRLLTAFFATHLGAELIERHGAPRATGGFSNPGGSPDDAAHPAAPGSAATGDAG